MGTSKKQKKRDGLRYREFVLSPYGVIKIKSLGYKLLFVLTDQCRLEGTVAVARNIELERPILATYALGCLCSGILNLAT